MKKYLFMLSLLCYSVLFSQTLERAVIGTSGTTYSSANASMNFTMGELVVTTGVDVNTTLTQGFHQEEIRLKIKLSPVVFLQGPLTTSGTTIMDDSLRSNSLLPTTSPYVDGVTCESSVFDITGNEAIIDWVLISLRDKNDPASEVVSQSALLQADGDIVGIDGRSSLKLDAPLDDYYVVINHRNHLGVMSASPVGLDTAVTTLDLSSTETSIFGGGNSVIDMGNGIQAMIGGDFDENGQIQSVDLNAMLSVLGTSGYNDADMDMNGEVQTLDVNTILIPNLGKGEPFNND